MMLGYRTSMFWPLQSEGQLDPSVLCEHLAIKQKTDTANYFISFFEKNRNKTHPICEDIAAENLCSCKAQTYQA